MKKFLHVAICLTLALMMVLTGCQAAPATGSASASAAAASTSVAPTTSAAPSETPVDDPRLATEAGVFPIVKAGNEVTLSIFTSTRPLCDDFVNNPYTKLVEETMGIKLEWDVAEESTSREKLNVMIAGGDYPDIITGWLKPGNFSLAEQSAYASQGILIPLNDMIDEYGYGYKKMLELYPAVKSQFTLDDGQIYTFPEVAECFHCQYNTKMWINQAWLDKLSLPVPTTTDEFYNVLTAFKTKDPNGNGQADEIPLAGSTNGWSTLPHKFIMNAFIYTDYENGYLFVKDGKVTAAFDKPEWKEGLVYMKKLVAEGLMAPESFTQKNEQLKLQAINGTIGATPAGWPGEFGDWANVEGNWLDYSIMAPLKGPAGVQTAWWNAYGVAQAKSFITDKCENPEVAFRFLDAFYINDGSNPVSMKKYMKGIEGVDWRLAEPGELGLDGKPAKFAAIDKTTSMDPKNQWWDQIEPVLLTSTMRNEWAIKPDSNPMETILFNGTLRMEPFKPNINTILPPLVSPADEAAQVGELKLTIQTYVDEMMTKMIITDADIETEWPNYIAELEKMGLAKYLEINQSAFDRKAK
jgi:putative aldouronate transport system substrate-binding protein